MEDCRLGRFECAIESGLLVSMFFTQDKINLWISLPVDVVPSKSTDELKSYLRNSWKKAS